VITELDGEPLEGMDELIATVNEGAPGDRVTLAVLRGGEEREVAVTLGKRPTEIQDAATPAQP
jgi:S1-C subfamily serine protease